MLRHANCMTVIILGVKLENTILGVKLVKQSVKLEPVLLWHAVILQFLFLF